MSETIDKINDDTEAAKRAAIKGLLRQCTQPEVTGFHRLFKEGIEGIPAKRLDDVIQLCERTIRTHKRRQSDD